MVLGGTCGTLVAGDDRQGFLARAHSKMEVSRMMDSSVVTALCRLPDNLQKCGDLSAWDLVLAAGYVPGSEVDEGLVESYLRTQPSLVGAWLALSGDQRGSGAWYFSEERRPCSGALVWVVALYPGGPRHEYTDRFKACAAYVRHFTQQVHAAGR